MERKRYDFIDVAKAIAIVLVVVGHWHPDNSPQWYEGVWKVIYSFHMPLFLMASGFLYMATYRAGQSYFTFLKKKVLRLAVPYLTVSCLVITIKLLTEKAGGGSSLDNPVTLFSYVQMFYLPVAGYFLWFIWTLMTAFVIMPAFRTKWLRLLLLIATIALAYSPLQFTKLFALEQSRLMLMYFVAGTVVFDFKEQLARLAKVPFAVTCGLMVAGEALYLTDVLPAVTCVLPFIGIATVFQLSDICVRRGRNGWFVKSAISVSIASYTIYLLHTTCEGFAKAALGKVPALISPENTALFVVGSLIIISVGVAVPYLLHYKVLSRWRITRFLFSIK